MFKDLTAPSWLTSTTSLGFTLVVIGALIYAHLNKDATLMVKLVEMIVPAFLMSKGIAMGKNGVKPDAVLPPR